MNKNEFENKYSKAQDEANKFFENKITELSKSILKGSNPKDIDLPTLQLSINFALRINEINEQRNYFILKSMLINQDD